MDKTKNTVRIQINPTLEEQYGSYTIYITLVDNGSDKPEGPAEDERGFPQAKNYSIPFIVGIDS